MQRGWAVLIIVGVCLLGGVCLHPRGVLVESVRSCSFGGVVCVCL